MDALFDLGLETSRWLQQTYPGLRSFFELLTALGYVEFYLAFLPFIYWTIHKKMGKNLVILVLFTDTLTNLFKHAFRAPRPFWLDSQLGSGDSETYGIPSGHTSITLVTYLTLASWIKKRWVWLVCITLPLLIAVSRIYLGVHFIHDVLGGLLLGSLVLVGYFLWLRYAEMRYNERILGQRLLIFLTMPLGTLLLYIIVLLIIGKPNLNVSWGSIIPSVERQQLESFASGFGVLLGAGIGFIFEGSRIRFRVDGPIWQRLARYVLGLIGVLLFWRGLKLILPEDPLWLGLLLRTLRYYLTGIWAAYYAPMLFVRLGLASADPDLGIQVTMRPKNPLKMG